MTEEESATKGEVAGCREAMPGFLDPLWLTMAHAPDQALLDVADLLRAELSDEAERLQALFAWLGHGEGECPICWMFVGRLPYSVGGWVARLEGVLEGAPPEVWTGACRFLATRLEPRHALPSGVSRESLSLALTELSELDQAFKTQLRQHWTKLGGAPERLAFA